MVWASACLAASVKPGKRRIHGRQCAGRLRCWLRCFPDKFPLIWPLPSLAPGSVETRGRPERWGNAMLELLDRQQKLTGNQWRIVLAAILGDMLEFFDYFPIGFVLAFIVGPWKLTYGLSAVILLSSGVGAIMGAVFWSWHADRIGRRKVFIATVINFSVATGILALTPENGCV